MPRKGITQVPPGLSDWLPGEAAFKRQLESRLAELFTRWGYREVITPTLEYLDTLVQEESLIAEVEMHKFVDREGHIVALRPDMTVPLARLVATRLREEEFPLRLFYLANVFRFESPQAGRRREFYQAGVELLGAAGCQADAEVIALAVESLRCVGVKNFQVGIGHVGIMEAEFGAVPGLDAENAKEALAGKDLVRLEALLDSSDLPARERERLMSLYTLYGRWEAVDRGLKLAATEKARAALEGLGKVLEALRAYGVEELVFLDLGIVRNFDYYTGIIFEGYAGGMGFPLLGGGRYDELLSKFGYSCPATGFALGVERGILALRREGLLTEEKEIDYLVTGSDYLAMI
ncbi:MAG: ATP phosphoribosyltransferase regulatory subunit, partial [Clostridia bacterium]|nr:ATP phosphoribosyltransferase regulatory subunit [Clostridia bacterium]